MFIRTCECVTSFCRSHLALCLIGVCALVGLAGNWVLSYASTAGDSDLLAMINVGVVALRITILTAVCLSIWKFGYSLTDYGFVRGTGFWVSLILVVGLVALKWRGAEPFPAIDAQFAIVVLGAALEELVFRVVLIRRLTMLWGKRRSRVFAAIVASSVLFTVAHIPIKSMPELQWIFISSIIMGYIYYWTRSALFPIAYHVLSNTLPMYGWWGGTMAVGVYCLLAFATGRGHGVVAEQEAGAGGTLVDSGGPTG
jgi:membrane protease YdiL (CAAX protease family)